MHDGAVLPILHLNGYKIAEPTVLARIDREELEQLLEGYGHKVYFVEGDDPKLVHQQLAATLDKVIAEIGTIQTEARARGFRHRPQWPMIVLRTPKGWTGPKKVDGVQIEGTWRAHQVPLAELATRPEHLRLLEAWMKSYKPEELFDAEGRLIAELAALAPEGLRRMGATPYANGGTLLKDLKMPDFRDYAVAVEKPGTQLAEGTRILGTFLRDMMKLNWEQRNFRVFGPDETASNRLTPLFDVTDRVSTAEILKSDDHLSPDGRVMEVLSEHLCEGWLEGYLLTGRHGLFSCYEAFIHIVDSMFNQHAKWLKVCRKIRWRRPIASLNYLLTSHVWRQDHNGFSHQDPGFIDHVDEQKGRRRPHLFAARRQHAPLRDGPLLAQPELRQCHHRRKTAGAAMARHRFCSEALHGGIGNLGVGEQRSRRQTRCDHGMRRGCGDPRDAQPPSNVLREHFPSLKVRVVNVVDLMSFAAAERTPPWLERQRLRQHLSQRRSHHLRLPRIPIRHSPPHLSPHQLSLYPCPRL